MPSTVKECAPEQYPRALPVLASGSGAARKQSRLPGNALFPNPPLQTTSILWLNIHSYRRTARIPEFPMRGTEQIRGHHR